MTTRTRAATKQIGKDLPMLRNSERSTFKRCRWKWYKEFEELLKPKSDIPALRFGSLVHQALATYYKPGIRRGVHPSITFERAYKRELDDLQTEFGLRVRREAEDDEVWVEAAELGVTMMDRYVDHYGKDDQWEVVVTEQPFRTLVYKPAPNGGEPEPWFWFVGVMDGVWRNRSTKKLHIVDHKTAAAIVLKYLALDPQATSYWTWGLDWIYGQGLLPRNKKVGGMLFNIMRKAKWDDRPQNAEGQYLNKDGTVSKKQPPPYFERQPIYRDWNEREGARHTVLQEYADMQAVRNDPDGFLYKNPGQFTCPGCWAFDVCELHEVGADWEELQKQTTREWDPYAQHEIYAGR